MMKALVKGQFLGNEQRKDKDGNVVNYAVLLCGLNTVKVKGIALNDEKMKDVTIPVELSAFEGSIYARYSK